MKTKAKKAATLAGFLLASTVLAALLLNTWSKGNSAAPHLEPQTPHYLSLNGNPSKIYIVSATPSYGLANQTYISADGQKILKGNRLFTINLTLRNDYTNEDPPPSMGTPVSPVDGTAYICLNFTLQNKNGFVNSINVTPPDFSSQSSDKTGLVLASGQTNSVEICLATNQTDISQFDVNLVSVSDSIHV